MSASPPSSTAKQPGFFGQGVREWGRKFRRSKLRRRIAASRRAQRDREAQIGETAWAEDLVPDTADELRLRLGGLEEAESGVASQRASIDEERARLEQERAAAVARFDERRAALTDDRNQARKRVAEAAEEDKPRAQAEVAAADAALAELARERKESLAPLDGRLKETRKAAAGAAKKSSALGREKLEVFGDLGRAVVAAGVTDLSLEEHLAELEANGRARAELEAALVHLQEKSAAVPRGVMLKFNVLVVTILIVLLAIVGLLWWWSPSGAPDASGGRRVDNTPRASGRSNPDRRAARPASETTIDAARLDELVSTLGSEDANARVEAGRELGAAGAGAVAALLGPLRDGDEATRADAAYALAEMTDLSPAAAAEAIPALVAALQDDAWRVRANAALALGKAGAGYDEVWEPLAATVDDAEPRVRGTATYALGRSGVRPADSVAILTGRLLEDEVPDVRVLAANALSLSGQRTAVPALATALADPNWEVQYASIRALGLLEDAAVEALPTLIDRLPVLKPWRAALVATSIRMIVEATAPQYRPPPDLVAALEQRIGTIARALPIDSPSDDAPIARALPILLRWAPGATTQLTVELTPQLWGTGEGSRRPMAQDLLPTLLVIAGAERPSIPALAEQLDAGDRNVRWAAAAALGATRNERAIAPLIGVLADQDPAVQQVAALGLAHVGPAARVPLSEALRHADTGVRLYAAYAIASMGRSRDGDDQAVVTALTAALQDDSFVVREAVACALKAIQRITPCDPEQLSGITGS